MAFRLLSGFLKVLSGFFSVLLVVFEGFDSGI